MFTQYQNRRIAQLIDKLVDHKITNVEYVEYQHLCKLLSGEYMPLNDDEYRSRTKRSESRTNSYY